MTVKNDKPQLKTIPITPAFKANLEFLRRFFTTEAAAIRTAVELLAKERAGEVEVRRRMPDA